MSNEINPAIKHFYFSALETKTMEEMKNANLNYGKLKEMIFIISEKRMCQQMHFDKKVFDPKKDEVSLTLNEVKGFTDSIGWDIEKELPKVKSIFIMMEFKKQIIFITRNNLDGTVSETQL